MSLDTLLDEAKRGCGATTDAELAKCLRVSRQAVFQWRDGNAYPSWATCNRIAQVCHLDLAHVLALVSAARLGESTGGSGVGHHPRQIRIAGL